MCKRTNITYEIQCVHCKKLGKTAVYVGESHRSWWDRQAEHVKALINMDNTYATVKHHREAHPEEDPDFTFKVTGVYKSSLKRQLMEAIKISTQKCDVLMNQRGEWGLNMVPTIGTKVLGNMGDWEESPGQQNSRQATQSNETCQSETGTEQLSYRQRKRRRKMVMEPEKDSKSDETLMQTIQEFFGGTTPETSGIGIQERPDREAQNGRNGTRRKATKRNREREMIPRVRKRDIWKRKEKRRATQR